MKKQIMWTHKKACLFGQSLNRTHLIRFKSLAMKASTKCTLPEQDVLLCWFVFQGYVSHHSQVKLTV